MPSRESDPSGFWGSLTAAVGALLALLVSFGVPLTEEQTVAILGFGTALGPIVTQWLIRKDAWSPVSVHDEVQEAYRDGLYMEPSLPPSDEEGAIDLRDILVVLLAVLVVVVLVRLL